MQTELLLEFFPSPKSMIDYRETLTLTGANGNVGSDSADYYEPKRKYFARKRYKAGEEIPHEVPVGIEVTQ